MENRTTQQIQPAKTSSRRDIHQQVTDTIIQQLQAGTVPWHKPWKNKNSTSFTIPKNVTTGKKYRGINIVLLWTAALNNHYQTQEWATFKQWQTSKEVIRKGEKGNLIVYYDCMEKDVDGEIKEIPFLKSSYVFNKSQLASYTPDPEPGEHPPFEEKIPAIEEFVSNTDACIINEEYDACYVAGLDRIYMPYPDDFVATECCSKIEAYYSVMMHEITHWTGHPRRLNRVFGKKFGDKDYTNEELVAELGAAFLCADLEITTATKRDHAAYIAHWLKTLKENKHCLLASASQASKAVEYLHNL